MCVLTCIHTLVSTEFHMLVKLCSDKAGNTTRVKLKREAQKFYIITFKLPCPIYVYKINGRKRDLN